jgi:hypothetical protein
VSGQLHVPAALPPGKEPRSTHWIGCWVDPRAGLKDVEKRKFLTLLGLELRPLGRPARSQSLYLLRYPGSYMFYIPLENIPGIFTTGYPARVRQDVQSAWRDYFRPVFKSFSGLNSCIAKPTEEMHIKTAAILFKKRRATITERGSVHGTERQPTFSSRYWQRIDSCWKWLEFISRFVVIPTNKVFMQHVGWTTGSHIDFISQLRNLLMPNTRISFPRSHLSSKNLHIMN